MDILKCNICGNTRGTLIITKNNYDIVKCSNCGLVYVNHSFSEQQLKNFYKEDYYSSKFDFLYKNYFAEKEIRINNFTKELSSLLKYTNRGKLLEIGCAAGFFLEVAKKYFTVQGIELSEYSSGFAKNTMGLPVNTGDLFSANFRSGDFDVVVMWDVIEHLKDPKSTLIEINKILKTGGILALSTGNINANIPKNNLSEWKMLMPPWHLFYFSKETINKILKESGFEIIKLKTRGLITKKRLLNNRIINCVGNMFNQGDIMIVYCRKIRKYGDL